MIAKTYKPVAVIVLDGFGIAPPSDSNAVYLAKKPVFDDLIKNYPHSVITAAGEAVGLPWQEMGNSEVGHMNIGSGRIVYQELPKINKAITDGTFFKNEAFLKVIEHVKTNKSALHLLGLASEGGVHSHIEHLFALMELAKMSKVKNVYLHVITDGRDTPPKVALDGIEMIRDRIKEIGVGEIASVSGRYFAMDRDERWDREEKAYKAIVLGEGPQANSAEKAIKDSYNREVFDEMIEPVTIAEKGRPIGKMNPKDGVIFFNFRSDRAKQMTKAIVLPGFDKFKRGPRIPDLEFATMIQYDRDLPVDIAYPPEKIENSLGEILANNKKTQFHIAETEKYAHVTVFFNCGRISPFPGEDRELITSPQVATYDLQPEMSASEVADRAVKKLSEGKTDFMILNFANPDMVGHTGNIPAATKAVEAADECLGKVVKKIFDLGGAAIITADHGNCEVMRNLQTGEMLKEHTANPVPFIIVAEDRRFKTPPKNLVTDLGVLAPVGVLGDVAPTVLDMMGLPKPKEMGGISLLNMI